MENKISIPKPCHENWDNMLPEEQGRHCLSCCKTVIDFSNWDNESIVTYLKQKNSERVCGRFSTDQIERQAAPQQELVHKVMRSRIPLLRKIAAIIILCFGLTGMEEANAQKIMGKIAAPKQPVEQQYTKGEIAIQPADTSKPKPPADTVKPMIMGMIAPYHPPKNKKVKQTKAVQQTKAVKTTPTIKTTPEKR